MKRILVYALALAATSAPLKAATITIADFETSSGYLPAGSGVSFATGNGWVPIFSSDPTRGRLTPDSLSGFGFVISGSQSAFISSGNMFQKSFASSSITAADLQHGELSWFQSSAGAFSSGNSHGLYIGSASGSTPIGIVGRNVDGVSKIWISGTSVSETAFSYASGRGTPNLNAIYKFSMTFDFTAHTMTAYYQDITNNGEKTLLGTVGFNPTLTAEILADNYGVLLYNNLGVTGYDDIQLTTIPEPSMVGLAGAMATLVILGHRFRRKNISPKLAARR